MFSLGITHKDQDALVISNYLEIKFVNYDIYFDFSAKLYIYRNKTFKNQIATLTINVPRHLLFWK